MRAVKSLAKLIARLLLLLFLAAVSLLVYLNIHGFPRFLKEFVINEVARSGYSIRFSEIRLDWVRGVIATDASLEDPKIPGRTLARIDEVQLHWNWDRLVHRKNPVDTLVVANATVSVPLPSDEVGPQQFTASDAYATFRIGDDGTIHIDQLTGVYCGIALHVTGELERPAPLVGAPKQPEANKSRFTFLASALRELNSLQISSPPQLDLDFDLDLGNPLGGHAKARLRATGVGYRKLQVDSAAVDVQMQDGAIQVEQFLVKIAGGEVSVNGRYDIAEGLFDLRLRSSIDPTALAVALPPQAAQAVGQVRFHENPKITARYTLSPDTGTLPKLQGTIETGGLDVRDVRFVSINCDFTIEGPQITIPDATIVTPEGRLTGHGQYHIESSDFNYAFDSTLDPRKMLPLMMPVVYRIVEPSWFETPPHIVASVSGDFVDPDAFAYDAQVTAEGCSYRGVALTGASAKVRLRHSQLDVQDLLLTRDEGEVRGQLQADFNRHRVSFDVQTTANPTEMAPLLGPKAAQIMHPYRFGPATQASARGVVDFDDPSGTLWTAQVGNEGFSYWKFTADRAQADLAFSNNVFRIDNFDADIYDGKMQGQAVFNLTNTVSYHFTFDTERCDVQKILTAVHGGQKKSRVTGLLTGQMDLTGQGSDFASLKGSGNLEVTDGVLWEAPIFGIFSQVLGNTKATDATATFTIAKEVVKTEDMKIAAGAFTANARGEVGFDGKIDFRVQAQFLRAFPGINILTFALGEILEYKVGGTIDRPAYRAVHLPKELLPHD